MQVQTQWIPTEDVQVGDRIVCSLSDAWAYPTVTGWTDRVLHLGGTIGDVTHRKFTVKGDVPWWVEYDEMQTTGSIRAGEPVVLRQMCIVAREPFTVPVVTDCVCGCLDPLPATCPDCHEPLTTDGTHRYSDSPLVQARAAGMLGLN